MQCEENYHTGRNSYYNVSVSYAYIINGRRFVESRIALWNRDLHGSGGRVHDFVAIHPVRAAVDVFYDPEHPENAVLIPGPDRGEQPSGHLVAVASPLPGDWCWWNRIRKNLAVMKTSLLSAEARACAHGPARPASLLHGFASYEPGSKRKVNVFPDKECLMEVLGHDGNPLQQWQPEDRMVDATGREYRLVKRTGQKLL